MRDVEYSEEWGEGLQESVDVALLQAEESGVDPWGVPYDGCSDCVRRVEWRMVMAATLDGAGEGLVS